MTTGIWLLFYDIAAAIVITMSIGFIAVIFLKSWPDRAIVRRHIWAPPVSANSDLYRFIAIFGGHSTRVFLDPSPAQLKLTQSDDTRAMMVLRQNPSSAILAHEWSWLAPQIQVLNSHRCPRCGNERAHIQILTVEAGGHDVNRWRFMCLKLAPEFAVQKWRLRAIK